MNYYDIISSCKLIVFLLLIFFVRQSTSKTKRSKKDGVLHVTRRQSDVTQENMRLPDVIDDVDDLTRLKGMQPDVDVSEADRRLDSCPPGCMSCDAVNGCTKCRSRSFLYLERHRDRQIGICVHQCPEGYYGLRGSINVCKKCEASHCTSCFTQNYCTSCKDGYFLHDAKCTKSCPSHHAPNNETRKCEKKVDCVVSSWSSWSKCARRSPSRSCKYGRKKRTRDIVQEPTENGKQCPKLKDTKKCRTPANKCPLINKWYQRQIKKMNRKKERKNSKGGKKRNKNNKAISSNASDQSRRQNSNQAGHTKRSMET